MLQYLLEAATGFRDVIYTDERNVQLEAHRCHPCRGVGTGLDWTGLGPGNVPRACATATWWSDACCTIANVLAHAHEVVVISSESSRVQV